MALCICGHNNTLVLEQRAENDKQEFPENYTYKETSMAQWPVRSQTALALMFHPEEKTNNP